MSAEDRLAAALAADVHVACEAVALSFAEGRRRNAARWDALRPGRERTGWMFVLGNPCELVRIDQLYRTWIAALKVQK